MTAQKLIAATLLIVAGHAFAAEAPATAGAANAAVTAAATAAATATASNATENKLNLPVLNVGSARDRDAVRAEAIEAAKTRKNTLAEQLAQYK